MKLKITSTTSEEFLGFEFENTFPITLPNGSVFYPDYVKVLPSGEYRLITSNFIIDAKET